MLPVFWRSGWPEPCDKRKHPRNSASADAFLREGGYRGIMATTSSPFMSPVSAKPMER